MNSFTKGARSESLLLKGKISWAKLFQPNKWDKWSVQFYPNAESLEIIREMQAEGLKNVLKKDDDGYHIQFSRPTTISLRKGTTVGVTPPLVVDKDGKPMEGIPIGNGSDVTLELEVYTHPVPLTDKRAKAARLLGVKVENLVAFDTKTDYQNGTEGAVARRLAEEPVQVW